MESDRGQEFQTNGLPGSSLPDAVQLMAHLLRFGETLSQHPHGVGERLSQEVMRITQGRAWLLRALTPKRVLAHLRVRIWAILHDAFMTLPRYTSTKKDKVQPVVEGALRCVRAWEALLPVPQTEFHHRHGISWSTKKESTHD